MAEFSKLITCFAITVGAVLSAKRSGCQEHPMHALNTGLVMLLKTAVMTMTTEMFFSPLLCLIASAFLAGVFFLTKFFACVF